MVENVETSMFIENMNEEFAVNPSLYKNVGNAIDIPENKVLKFTLKNLDVSFANSIRRVILSEIPCIVLDSLDKENVDDQNITIYNNNSIFNNEIVKQRLSCIPVCKTDIEDFEYQNYIVECDVKNNTEEKMIVTTEDFKIKNKISGEYLDKEDVQKIFKKNPLTNQFIDIIQLQPNFNDNNFEKLKFDCGFKIGIAKENGSYNVASMSVYSNTLDNEEIKKVWEKMEEKLPQNKEERELAYNDFINLDAQRITKPNSFDFKVQSIGIYSNYDLVILACEVMIQKFEKFINNLEKDDQLIKKNNELMENAYNITLNNEDYTFGKVLENMSYLQFYIQKQKINYISMKKNHPHDNYSILMISYKNENTTNEEIVTDMKEISKLCIDVYQNIKSNMKKL